MPKKHINNLTNDGRNVYSTSHVINEISATLDMVTDSKYVEHLRHFSGIRHETFWQDDGARKSNELFPIARVFRGKEKTVQPLKYRRYTVSDITLGDKI
jgi:hypothetical protein